jgi:fluoroquinolone transport system permease protein
MRTAVLLGFGRNDVRAMRQEPMLLMLALLPLILLAVARLVTGPLAAWLLDAHGVDLTPHHSLLVGFLLVLVAPMMMGVLAGLVILDDRDQRLLTTLQVTPLSLDGYRNYRLTVTVLASALALLVTVPATGLVPAGRLAAAVPALLLASLLAPISALLLAAFAGNKVEGLAVMKALNLPMVLPVVVWFAHGPWEIPLALVPTYWPLRAFWEAVAGGSPWPWVLGGTAYLAVWIAWLLRRFNRRVRAA